MFLTVAPIHPRLPATADFNLQLGSIDPKVQAGVLEVVKKDCDKFKIVGATVALVIDGKLAAAVAVGKRKFGSPEPIQVTDPMHIASNTKGMTGLIFGRLEERGKLRFRQSAAKTFPFKLSRDFAGVPLIEFLYQRSGIDDKTAPNIGDIKYGPPPGKDPYHGPGKEYEAKRLEYVKDCLATKTDFPPASRFEYCNANYVILGAAEELATRQVWEDMIETEIFKPFHMRAAGFSAMGTGQDVSVPWQHYQENGTWKPVYDDNPRFMGPAGLVHCSVLDLANYAYGHVAGAYGLGNYLRPRTWRIIQTPPKGSFYACGILAGPADERGVRDMSHRGSNTLSFSQWDVRDHGRTVIVVMINCASEEGNDTLINDLIDYGHTVIVKKDAATRSPNR